ncbi:MAG: EXLDI protein, partial [Chloroflexota bacterium]
KRFMGVRLARWLQETANNKGTEILNVYQTAGKRFALHTRSISDWELSWGDPDFARHPKNFGIADSILKRFTSWGYDDWETFKVAGDYRLEVFESLEELKAHVSNDLFNRVRQAMEYPDIEELDI